MSTATMTEKDVRVRDAVQRQLEWDPEVDASAIGVAAKDGSVTLTGYIDSYAGKLAAGRVAKHIAADAARALDLHATIPPGVKAMVHDGHLTLTGVRSVVNYLTLAPRAVERDAHHRINAALRRNATVDAQQIAVTVDGNTVTLTGTVRTWRARDSAERAVADGPGITTVINRIVVAPAESDDTYEID